MLSDGTDSAVISMVFEGEAPSKDELAVRILDELKGNGQFIDADVFTYCGYTLVIARTAGPLRDRFSSRARITRSSGAR